MGLFSFGEDEDLPVFTEPVDPGWVHGPDGGFFALLTIDPEELGLTGGGGIYLIWHGGVRPEWVYAGHTDDLAAALHQAGNTSEINYYEKNGGLFVAWAPVRDKFRAGVVKYLDENFKTLVQNPGAYTEDAKPVPVTAPLRKKP